MTNGTAKDAFPVVGVGASAGGLEAFRKLLGALPADTGIAFVLIPHLDPSHESMMVDLLGRDTKMKVAQAADGLALERNCVYVIPPQAYLSVDDGSLRISQPRVPHGARLPFDFFLNSLADAYRQRAACVILSGTGADGSIGLKAVNEAGGLVIVQDPTEAAFDGMPRSAIATGAVNLVLPVAEIPQALIHYARHPYIATDLAATSPEEADDRLLSEIIELLRVRTSHDFRHYRKPTLLRRVHRRMAAAGTPEIGAYLNILRRDGPELAQLAKDCLIHITSFFRDAAAFQGLAKLIIPQLARVLAENQKIRVWVPGCSTGEEVYSLAILFFEEFAAPNRAARPRIFASDISADAVAFGRHGVYPDSIKADVSAERLQRFFSHQDNGQINRELREAIVFTVQDALAEPPFSNLDLISCRNFLMYLQPAEQQKVLSRFHFALNEGGFLFLGASEHAGGVGELFEPVPDAPQVFRRIGRGRSREKVFRADIGERSRALWPRVTSRPERKPSSLADIAQRTLLETYAPASVLVDASYRVLYLSGATDRFLRVARGVPSQDALAMLRDGLASRFRAAVRQAIREQAPAAVSGVRMKRNGDDVLVSITARPLQHDGQQLLLVSFADAPELQAVEAAEMPGETSRVAQLEHELEETRKELESTIRELEDANQELSAANEEAVSVNEEFQSTNEELETSKEELQSLNEELTTTNNQLHESLETQRRTSDDLQNILNSSDAATLFLDKDLNIRFFTPSAGSRFSLIPSDVGRPLANFANPFPEINLLADARSVLASLMTIRHEVRSASGTWYWYRTSPYRTQDNRIEGVVISLGDISEIKAVEQETRAARAYAEAIIDTIHEPLIVLDGEMCVVSASRSFLRYFRASPEDTIGRLLPDTDAHHLDVPALREFLDRVEAGKRGAETCEIEINLEWLGRRTLIVTAEQIRDESIAKRRTLLALNDITDFRRSEQELAAAKQAAEQSNLAKSRFLAAVSHDLRQPLQTVTFLHAALRSEAKTDKAAELLSRAETALGSMSGTLDALLDINQLEAGAIEPQPTDFPINDLLDTLDREYGLQAQARGLGWRVVRCRLGVHSDPRLLGEILRNLLSNAIRYTGKGKVLLGCRRRGNNLRIEVWDSGIGIAETELPNIFREYYQAATPTGTGSRGLGLAIVQRLGELLGHPIGVRSRIGKGSVFTIDVPLARGAPTRASRLGAVVPSGRAQRRGAILVIEDIATVRETLQLVLAGEGHRTAGVASGPEALALLTEGKFRPDLVVSDYVLPDGMNGAQAVTAVRAALGQQIPAVFVTGDIGSQSLGDLALTDSIRLTKPVSPEALSQAIQQVLASAPLAEMADPETPPTVFIVDDDQGARDSMREVLMAEGYRVEIFASGDALLAADDPPEKACLVVDVRMPGMNGFELLARLRAAASTLPAIMVTGHGDVPMAVEAMKAGAADFIQKPVRAEQLLASIERALRHAARPAERFTWRTAAAMRVAGLTRREREVLDQVVAGHANKEIAARLGIAQRTVETHRANVMKKMGATSLSDLVRLTIAAGGV